MLPTEFYVHNRQRFIERMKDQSLAIFLSGGLVTKSEDVTYPFFVNRNFLYMSGIEIPNCALVLLKSGDVCKELLFAENLSLDHVRWFGKRMSDVEIKEKSGLEVYDTTENVGKHLEDWLMNSTIGTVYVEKPDKSLVKEQVVAIRPDISIIDLMQDMKYLRTYKAAVEIEEMRKGVLIADKCFRTLMHDVKVGMSEYEAKALFEYTAARYGIRDMAFQPIIATGDNIFTIHYDAYKDTVNPHELFLCDAGVNQGGLCCDISRTWPIDDWFTTEQEHYYRCALECSQELFSEIKPGMQMRDVYRKQHRLMRKKLVEYHIATDEEDAKQYIWHGGAHHIGFDNHDKVYIEEQPENLLVSNMVIAVDIGIYNPSKHIGLRVEDDCLVTSTGSENLTRCIPRELSELKEIMRFRNEERYSG